jgi:hypothetical protein
LGISPDGLKPTKLALMQASSYMLLMLMQAMSRQGLWGSSVGILVCKLLKMVITASNIVC